MGIIVNYSRKIEPLPDSKIRHSNDIIGTHAHIHKYSINSDLRHSLHHLSMQRATERLQALPRKSIHRTSPATDTVEYIHAYIRIYIVHTCTLCTYVYTYIRCTHVHAEYEIKYLNWSAILSCSYEFDWPLAQLL